MKAKESDQGFKEYEISFLALTETTGQQVSSLLTKLGMEILLDGPIRQIKLAYPIKKHQGAFFGYCHFQAAPEKVASLKNELSLNKEIIRFLAVTPVIKKIVDRNRPPMERPAIRKEVIETNRAPFHSEELKPEILSNELLEKKLEEILK